MAIIGTFGRLTFQRLKIKRDQPPAQTTTGLTVGQPMGILLTLTYAS